MQLGLVESLNRPGGNLTGATTLTLEVGAKRLEMLHQLVPAAKIIGVLVNPTSPNLAAAQSKACRPRLAFSVWRFTDCRPAPIGTSILSLHALPNWGFRHWWLPRTHSSSAGADSSPRWRPPCGARDLWIS